jgi:hypothetical protein
MARFQVDSIRSSLDRHFGGFTWRLWYAVVLFGTMGVARGLSCHFDVCTDAAANFTALGLEEALVGTMVEQQSFIKDFGLDEMSDDQKAETVGNVVSMSQLGCIAGALM